MTEQITGRAHELLAALRATGVWLTRVEIARATGKNRLSPHDVELLDRLVNAGLVEKRRRDSNTPIGIAFDYRSVERED